MAGIDAALCTGSVEAAKKYTDRQRQPADKTHGAHLFLPKCCSFAPSASVASVESAVDGFGKKLSLSPMDAAVWPARPTVHVIKVIKGRTGSGEARFCR
ncbi:MAG: hypothetical protein ABSC37_10565, partial [Xanthobacteraceae bacterium]